MTVTIIGAGIVGCAIAYEMASRGAAVQVLENRGAGMGATRASAGILAPRIEGHSSSLLRLGLCGLGVYDEFVARVCADTGAAFEYERGGTLQVALDAGGAERLRAESERLTTLRVSHTLVEGRDVARFEPALSHRATAALLLSDHGYIVADAFTTALADAASRRGATFVAARAEAVHAGETCAEVATESGRIQSDAVVVAGGSWSSALVASLPALVKPVRGQLLHLWTDPRPATRVIWGERCYVVPRSDGSVLVGATVEDAGFDETATVAGVSGLLGAAVELVPSLEQARFDEVRVGLRPMLADELPAIGLSSITPRIAFAIGHYRNGVLLAPLTALMVADLVLEGRQRPELALTRPDRLGL